MEVKARKPMGIRDQDQVLGEGHRERILDLGACGASNFATQLTNGSTLCIACYTPKTR